MYVNDIVMTALHRERLQEAEKQRLVMETLEAQREAFRGYNPTLAWVGNRIMNIGSKIVEISGQPEQSLN